MVHKHLILQTFGEKEIKSFLLTYTPMYLIYPSKPTFLLQEDLTVSQMCMCLNTRTDSLIRSLLIKFSMPLLSACFVYFTRSVENIHSVQEKTDDDFSGVGYV